MSQSSSDVSVDTSSTIDIVQRLHGIAPSGSRVTTAYIPTTSTRAYLHQLQPTQHLQQPQQTRPLLRKYTTLQDHAAAIIRAEHADHNALTPRYEGRRGSFAWDLSAAFEDEEPKLTRDPMMPQQSDNHTPPTMEELVRRNTHEDDASSVRRSSLVNSDTVFSRPSTARSSTGGTDVDSISQSDTGKSTGGLARSMTTKVPDMEARQLSISKAQRSVSVPQEGQRDDVSFIRGSRTGRKLSFQLPSGLMMRSPIEHAQQPFPVKDSPTPESPTQVTSPQLTTKCSGLAARRQVKMDLTLPLRLLDLPKPVERRRAPPVIPSSITPANSRSLKTLWAHEPESDRATNDKATAVRSAPIIEDDENIDAAETITLHDAGVELGTTSALPFSAPVATALVQPPSKVRNRCVIGRSSARRDKSGGTSTTESDVGSTPDHHWTPGLKEGMTEQEVTVQNKLVQLAKTSTTARSHHWPWNKPKALSSDEHTHTKEEQEDRKSISANIFRRSNRFLGTPEKEKRDKKSPKEWNIPWRRDKHINKSPLPSASLANMSVPPSFVPPGCEEVRTPMHDAASEVRGKLAGFFFESNSLNAKTKRRTKTSPGGYWDSNAVLMSMNIDQDLSNTEDEEVGPKGRPPAAFHLGPVNDTPALMTGPGLYIGPDVNLTVKVASGVPDISRTRSSLSRDSWSRMHFGKETPDVDLLTAAALREADERRKFEWLVPEHLPNSPICPLNVKYVGPSKGLCYWHGRRSNGWGVEPGRDYVSHPVRIGKGSSGGWEIGKQESPRVDTRKRRLESLSNP